MAHRVVTFTLVDADGDEALDRVKSLPGVVNAARVSPHSRSAVGRRIAYANVAEAASMVAARDAIAAVEGVESAAIPPDRVAQKGSS